MLQFSHQIDAAGLYDLGFIGSPFTWKRGSIQERLDRFLANSTWMDSFSVTQNHHLPKLNSDHSPLLLKIAIGQHNSHSPFRFLNVWVEHREFLQEVQRGWQLQNVEPNAMIRLWRLQKNLGYHLRKWN